MKIHGTCLVYNVFHFVMCVFLCRRDDVVIVSADGVVKLWDLETVDSFPVADWREHTQGEKTVSRECTLWRTQVHCEREGGGVGCGWGVVDATGTSLLGQPCSMPLAFGRGNVPVVALVSFIKLLGWYRRCDFCRRKYCWWSKFTSRSGFGEELPALL